MKATLLTLTLATQLTAVSALAQTTASESSGTNGVGPVFGSDWPTTLASAMFSDDGVTLRAQSELATRWSTLSAEDKAMIRRDCTALVQKSGGTTGLTVGTGTTTPPAPTASATGATAGNATNSTIKGAADSTTGKDGTLRGVLNVPEARFEQICAATNDL